MCVTPPPANIAFASMVLHSSHIPQQVVSLRRFGSKAPSSPCLQKRSRGGRTSSNTAVVHSAGSGLKVDVAVVGAGIIGLSVAEALLSATSDLSVAVIDRAVPCSGGAATGAGQGYIWLAHRDPASPAWQLVAHSKHLWEAQANRISGGNSQTGTHAYGWQANGSLLVASTAAEANSLEQRAELLAGVGLQSSLIPAHDLHSIEPSLSLPADGAGLLVASDAQLDGRMAVERLVRKLRQLGSRCHLLFNELVEELLISGSAGCVTGLKTATQRITAGTVVVAAGAWSGALLADALSDDVWHTTFSPRRGHLLEMRLPPHMSPLNHGIMEVGYAKHYSKLADGPEEATDITFTASIGASGHLLLGSSREWSGWDVDCSQRIVAAVLHHAQSFLPALRQAELASLNMAPRVGLRPYAKGGLPFVGAVEGVEGLLLAAGHEGSGLCLAPITAEIIRQIVLDPVGDVNISGSESLLPSTRLKDLSVSTAL